jgi:ATP-dependent Clp protease ATP-binding subunit ClpC
MRELYTEPARRAIFFARYEASQYGSPKIESEHLLLGLLREGKKHAPVLSQIGRRELIRKEIESRIIPGAPISTSVQLPLSAECKSILQYALDSAEHLGHPQVDLVHLILAILREERCMAAEILRERGVEASSLKAEAGESAEAAVSLVESRATAQSEHAVDRIQAAWKARDAKTVARFFHFKGMFADLHGNRWTGSEDIEKAIAEFFSSARISELQGDVEDLRAVAPDLVVLTLGGKPEGEAEASRLSRLRLVVVMRNSHGTRCILTAHLISIPAE